MEAKEFYNSKKPVEMSKRHLQSTYKVKHFNNYVKSLLLTLFCPSGAQIVDMASGFGADVTKYVYYKPQRVIFTDVAKKALEECEQRLYRLPDSRRYEAYFVEADFTQPWNLPSHPIAQVVICQFAMHYALRPNPSTHVANPEKNASLVNVMVKNKEAIDETPQKTNNPLLHLHTFFKTVSTMLQSNGLFWGIVADGKSVLSLLQDKEQYKGKLFTLTRVTPLTKSNSNNDSTDGGASSSSSSSFSSSPSTSLDSIASGQAYIMQMGEGSKDVNATEYTTCESDVVHVASQYGMEKKFWCPVPEFANKYANYPANINLRRNIFNLESESMKPSEQDFELLQIYSVFLFVKKA